MFSDVLTHRTIQRISSVAPHSAFCDLIRLDPDTLLCCYRQGDTHVSPDGIIEISGIGNDGRVRFRQRLHLPGADLRDPKLSRDARGTLWLLAYAKYPETRKMVSWFSTTGKSWSSCHDTGVRRDWLWRTVWHQNESWGLAYHRARNTLDLYRGHLGKRMFLHHEQALSKDKHRLGYPNESDLFFDQNQTLWALVRRDADTFTAQLGKADAPYTRWQWQDLGEYIGGPAWLPLTGDTMLVAGRRWDGKHLRTCLWLLNRTSGALEVLMTLPSAGDNSYPGLVITGDTLHVAYYSEHVDRQSRVYLATLSGLEKLRDVIKQ
ncbi:hypothetical protein [Alteromonas sp. CYL-A6]|uniref:hypothetical protein n=1 Tax=Alteromonas nitratireducens TaxID=3390813 RepID=UPI0034B98C02